MTDNGKHAITELSIDAKLLEAFVEKRVEADRHGLISYGSMTKEIGRNVQKDGRGILNTVRRRLLRDSTKRWAFVTLRDEGIKLARGSEHTGIALSQIRRGVRANKRALRASMAIPQKDYESLTPEERLQHDTANTVLAVCGTVTGRRSRKVIEGAVAESGKLIAGQKVIDYLAGKN